MHRSGPRVEYSWEGDVGLVLKRVWGKENYVGKGFQIQWGCTGRNILNNWIDGQLVK